MTRRFLGANRGGRKQASGLADVPFDGMEPEAAVGDVGYPDILGGWDEILDSLGDQGAHGYLKRQ